MRARVIVVGIGLFVVGLGMGLLSPSLKAQANSDACAAPWVVVEGSERAEGGGGANGWHAVKLNRCTGEVLVFSIAGHRVTEKDAWYKLPVK